MVKVECYVYFKIYKEEQVILLKLDPIYYIEIIKYITSFFNFFMILLFFENIC